MSGEKPYRRHGRAARGGGGGGRTVLWILLIVVMAVAVGVALAREATKDDAGADAPVAESVPTQRLLIREGLRREDIARLLDQETAIPGARYLALTRVRDHAGRPLSDVVENQVAAVVGNYLAFPLRSASLAPPALAAAVLQ